MHHFSSFGISFLNVKPLSYAFHVTLSFMIHGEVPEGICLSLIMRDILFSHINIKGLLTFEGNWWLFLYSYRTSFFFHSCLCKHVYQWLMLLNVCVLYNKTWMPIAVILLCQIHLIGYFQSGRGNWDVALAWLMVDGGRLSQMQMHGAGMVIAPYYTADVKPPKRDSIIRD